MVLSGTGYMLHQVTPERLHLHQVFVKSLVPH